MSRDPNPPLGSIGRPQPPDEAAGRRRFGRAPLEARPAATPPPPPGTYAPALDARATAPAAIGPPGPTEANRARAELSPQAQACLADVFALLDRASALLAQAAAMVGGAGPNAPLRAAPVPVTGAAAHSPRTAAVELAVGGASRGQVAQRLAAEHAVADPSRLLDEVFGPGSPPASRLLDQVTRRP